MRRKMTSRHNFWGGPSGPPGFVPIIDPGEVWTDESLHSVYSLRLTKDELLPIIEAIGQEPLGRYGNFSNGSDYFWAFRSEEDRNAAMERESAVLSALRPQIVAEVATKPRPAEEPSAPDDTRQNCPYMESEEPLFPLPRSVASPQSESSSTNCCRA